MAASALQLGGSLKTQVEQQHGFTRVVLSGHINEATDLLPLAKLPGPLVIDLRDLDRINSVGVKNWTDFVRACEKAGIGLTFERCSPIIVGQMSMITKFMGTRSHVKSVDVPYLCRACSHEHVEVLEISPGIQVQPKLACPRCKGEMVVDDLVETYNEVLSRL